MARALEATRSCYVFRCPACGFTRKQPEGVASVPKCPQGCRETIQVEGHDIPGPYLSMTYVTMVHAGVLVISGEQPEGAGEGRGRGEGDPSDHASTMPNLGQL